MKTLLKVFVLVTVLYFASGNCDSVTKDEFNELKQVYNILRKKCKDLEAELKSTQSRLREFEHKMELSDLYSHPITSKDNSPNAYSEKNNQGPVGPERKDTIIIKDSSKTDRQSEETLKHQNKTTMMMEENNLINRIVKRLNSESSLPRLAFSARNIADNTDLRHHQTLKFPQVIINEGNCYHQTTGLFSPNIPGVYVFYFSIITAPDVELRTTLVKDGTEISYSYANGASSKYSQGGNMAIVHLNVGDNVWVRIETSHPPAGYNLGTTENSFSGFLLYSDNQ